MGKLSQREETTKYASKTINSYLKNDKHTVALPLSSIYADIRLRTLLTDWISPPKRKWKKTSKILDRFDLWKLIGLCNEHKLLRDNEKKNLHALREKRNKVAHESDLWKKLSDDEKKEIENLCRFTIQFLERTKH